MPRQHTAVVAWTKFCSDHFIIIQMRVRWKFHRIWILVKKLSVKWAPGLKYIYSYCIYTSIQWKYIQGSFSSKYLLNTIQWYVHIQVLELMQMHPKERLRQVIMTASWFDVVSGILVAHCTTTPFLHLRTAPHVNSGGCYSIRVRDVRGTVAPSPTVYGITLQQQTGSRRKW